MVFCRARVGSEICRVRSGSQGSYSSPGVLSSYSGPTHRAELQTVYYLHLVALHFSHTHFHSIVLEAAGCIAPSGILSAVLSLVTIRLASLAFACNSTQFVSAT